MELTPVAGHSAYVQDLSAVWIDLCVNKNDFARFQIPFSILMVLPCFSRALMHHFALHQPRTDEKQTQRELPPARFRMNIAQNPQQYKVLFTCFLLF